MNASLPEAKSSGRPLRLFVACDLPNDTLAALATWQRREIGPHQELRINHSLHLTLSFLGATDPAALPHLVEVLRGITWSPCQVTMGEILFLPRRGPRHVIALSLEDSEGLRALQSRLSAALVDAGLARPEKKPWLPHVTVARYRRPGQPFPLQNVIIAKFCVVRMALYSSSLESAGAVHTSLAEFPASGAREERHFG
jgi:2'-5' RNA ligase